MKLVKSGIPFLCLMLCSVAAQADAAQGKMLHEKNCTRCHNSSVYTRTNRQVTSLKALEERVNRCETPAGVKWTQQQTMAVVKYLNTEFYHFK